MVATKVASAKPQTSSGFTKEEELLLQDFSRNVSTKSSALFYGNAFIVSALPICKFHFIKFQSFTRKKTLVLFINSFFSIKIGLFWRVHSMEFLSSSIFFVLVTGLATYLMAMAYKNTKFQLKHKVAIKREDAVTREMTKELAEDKKMSRKEKDER